MTSRTYRRTLVGLLFIGLASPIAAADATGSDDSASGDADASKVAAKVRSGKYIGHRIKNGKPSKKQWLRFRVTKKRKYVTKYRSRIWVICYSYPSTYLSLPVKFSAPPARIRKGRVNRRWRKKFTVDGERYTLKGRLKLNLRKPKVRGRVSLDFGPCGTKTGKPPNFVPIRAHHR